MKKTICILLALCLCLGCAACGSRRQVGQRIQTIQVLVEQDYSLAFRAYDNTEIYVTAAIEVLSAQGKVDELAQKWFGDRIISFPRDATALDEFEEIVGRDLIVGVDINSFPLAYLANGQYWGFDVELAYAVCELLGWNLKFQSIEKENVYVELSSGNIDVAWGGIALDESQVQQGLYSQYGPYVHNDIVIAARSGAFLFNKLMLGGKTLAMSSTPEAMDALNSDAKLAKRMGRVTRLAGGTLECFDYLLGGKCDAVLTDSTAVYYFNCH